MAPGNAWHFPGIAEVPTNVTMRSPVFPTDLKTPVSIFSGNQSAGGDGAANQLQDGSFVRYKRSTDANWKSVPMVFEREVRNNKYFRADIPLTEFAALNQVQYYLVLAYSDRDTTFLGVGQNDPTGWDSGVSTTETAAQARPFIFTIGTQNQQKPFVFAPENPKVQGQWSEIIPLPNVAAHAHLLRNGTVLMWGRRDNPQQSMNTFPATPLGPGQNADAATCTPFILNPKARDLDPKPAQQPFMPDGVRLNANLPKMKGTSAKVNANLFCSGHAFQSDGSLVVAGGHLYDQRGLDQTCIYEPIQGTWTAVPAVNGAVMGNGRWYPTVTALPTGASLVTSGSYQQGDQTPNNNDTQILSDVTYASVDKTPLRPFDLYPRMHVASSGIIYWVSLVDIMYLDQPNKKAWQVFPTPRENNQPTRPERDYACSVLYDKDKVMYIGGGIRPSARTDILDISNVKSLAWQETNPMLVPRRQHNATVLPDGSVLVTGGTRGDGDGATENAGDVRFNDLRPGRPVHVAELWNPTSQKWTTMASEQIDRCYHSTAVLLPDARVLSAGGGEFQLSGRPNDEKDSHRDAQIFSPPYLFLDGPQPKIESISNKLIECRSTFDVGTAEPDKIDKISLIGLSSVTHSNNFGQRLMFLTFKVNNKMLTVDAPTGSSSCPPGYYMLFLVNKTGFPSEAEIVQIKPTATSEERHQKITARLVAEKNKPVSLLEVREEVRKATNVTRIELGITATCPYGLSACWGGAFEALSNLTGVERVDPVPHSSGSTASVFLADNGLPDFDAWTGQFKGFVQETYGLRGFEADVHGTVEVRDNGIVLVAIDGVRPEVSLIPLGPEAKIQRDNVAQRPQAVTQDEVAAYDKLVQLASSDNAKSVHVIGPVSKTEAGYQLQVRIVK